VAEAAKVIENTQRDAKHVHINAEQFT